MESPRRSLPIRNGGSKRFSNIACIAALFVSTFGSALGQEPGKLQSLLPATTGAPLTLKPLDSPDIQCSVFSWRSTPLTPILTLLCPPADVFAPLHVYLLLSWRDQENAPSYAQGIKASPNSLTFLRTSKTTALVSLDVLNKETNRFERRWVSFDAVVDVALSAELRSVRSTR